MLTVELPWPSSKLLPNRSHGLHWAKSSALRASAFEAAYLLTHQAVGKYSGVWYSLTGNVPLTITFNPPDKRKRDLDGALSSLKTSLDGVATALTIDDSKFNPITLKRGEPVKGGSVLVVIGGEA